LSLACLATACFVDNLETIAQRIVGSVRPGGRIVLIEPFHTNPWLTRGCKTTPRRVVDLFERLGKRPVIDFSSIQFHIGSWMPNEAYLAQGIGALVLAIWIHWMKHQDPRPTQRIWLIEP
jgi:hypothetical protein